MQDCLKQAEEILIKVVEEKYDALNEEMITHLFWCELKYVVTAHNKRGDWSKALAKDLTAAFPSLDADDFRQDVGGLFCDVQLHNHQREGETGGDFGLFTSLPVIEYQLCSTNELRIPIRDRAVLVQAKLGQRNESFGELTEKQEEHLPARADYSAFVLYGYDDKDKTTLSPFQWQSCAGTKLEDMKDWLKNGKLPKPLYSSEMIRLLYDKKLGTDDKSIIKTLIAVEERPRFEIKLHWPTRSGPDGLTIKLANSVSVYQQQQH